MIRTDRIGDVILTLPMIDVLKINFPDALVDFLVNYRVVELIDDYPNINKVQSIEKDSIKAIKQICKINKYDLAIVVHPTFKIAFSIFLSGINNRLGTAYRWYSFLFNIKHNQHRKFSKKHELEYNLELLKEINCKLFEGIKPVLQISDETISLLKSKTNRVGFDLKSDFIVIHPGSLGSAKVWGKDNFMRLINLINTDIDLNLNISLTGSKDEETLINSILNDIIYSEKVATFTNLNLKELSALIKSAKLFISNSTGPIHIAAAVGTFAIGFYPSERVESATRWAPYTEKRKIFSSNLKGEKNPYMDDISPDEVFNFIKSYLKSLT